MRTWNNFTDVRTTDFQCPYDRLPFFAQVTPIFWETMNFPQTPIQLLNNTLEGIAYQFRIPFKYGLGEISSWSWRLEKCVFSASVRQICFLLISPIQNFEIFWQSCLTDPFRRTLHLVKHLFELASFCTYEIEKCVWMSVRHVWNRPFASHWESS